MKLKTKSYLTYTTAILAGFILLNLSSCDSSTETEIDEVREVNVNFAARWSGQNLGCSDTGTAAEFTRHDNTGSDTTYRVRLKDLRFFIHNVTVTAGGEEYLLNMNDDGRFHYRGVALIDLEDAAGDCTGTDVTNSTVTGTAVNLPADEEITAVSFTLGVPEELNHLDPTSQQEPLLSGMHWSWLGGYKFMQAELFGSDNTGSFSAANTMLFHLGSTMCTTDDSDTFANVSCANANRPTVTVDGFNPDSDTLSVDLEQLLGFDLQVDQLGLCHSMSTQASCRTYFNHTGLDFTWGEATDSGAPFNLTGSTAYPSAGQQVFSVLTENL